MRCFYERCTHDLRHLIHSQTHEKFGYKSRLTKNSKKKMRSTKNKKKLRKRTCSDDDDNLSKI